MPLTNHILEIGEGIAAKQHKKQTTNLSIYYKASDVSRI